jgi:hypothetical protein
MAKAETRVETVDHEELASGVLCVVAGSRIGFVRTRSKDGNAYDYIPVRVEQQGGVKLLFAVSDKATELEVLKDVNSFLVHELCLSLAVPTGIKIELADTSELDLPVQ